MRQSVKLSRSLIFLGGVFCALVLLFPTASIHAQDSQPVFAPVKARLDIPIPYVDLSTPVKNGDKITVPFVAQYISGIYQFLISIVGVVAGVFILIGGFQYLTAGGSQEKVATAKRRIQNAVLGLIVAFGSYTILFLINPELLKFKDLELTSIDTDLFEYSLGNTKAITSLDGEGIDSGATPGSYIPTIRTCPFTLEKTSGSTGRQEFYSKIESSNALTGTSVRQKVFQVAEIANACNVDLGSCGATAGTILALAARGTENYTKMVKNSSARGDCLSPQSKENCNGTRLRRKKTVSQSQRLFMYGWRCNLDADAKNLSSKYADKCISGPGAAWKAVAKVRDHFLAEERAGRLEGWPDKWADELRVGDYVVIYNGNRDLVGAHAVIFMGWEASGQWMQVIQGGGGGSGIKRGKSRPGRWCVRSSCGSKMVPLVYINSPD